MNRCMNKSLILGYILALYSTFFFVDKRIHCFQDGLQGVLFLITFYTFVTLSLLKIPFAVFLILFSILMSIGNVLFTECTVFKNDSSRIHFQLNHLYNLYSQMINRRPLSEQYDCDIPLCDPTSPKLLDYHIASSYETCLLPDNKHVSLVPLDLAITAGARFIHLPISTDISLKRDGSYKITPVIRAEVNSIKVKDCFQLIVREAFRLEHEDPFIVFLDFQENNVEMLSQVAHLIIKNVPSKHLFESVYSFTSKRDVTHEPLCNLYNKVIFASHGKMPNTLKELIQLHTDKNFQIFEFTQVTSNTQRKFSMVKPDGAYPNVNPSDAWEKGHHSVLMRYTSLDKVMESHCKKFSKNSLIIQKKDE